VIHLKDVSEQADIDVDMVSEQSYFEQVNMSGGVMVTVTPQSSVSLLGNGISFDISLNTHSVELNQDLLNVSVLLDGNGNEYIPVAWEGDPPEGHHRSGVLSFGDNTSELITFSLVIKNIGSVSERIFEWKG